MVLKTSEQRKFTRKYKGLCLGQELWIRQEPRRSTADPYPNPVLYWGGKKLVLDHARLPGNVARLVPEAYGTPRVTAKDWEQFVEEAEKCNLFCEGFFYG